MTGRYESRSSVSQHAQKYALLKKGSFRDRGIFYEAVTNEILDTLVAALAPRRMTVCGEFSARGGITTTIRCSHP